MIDFHSHILPNIDDGSVNMEETVELLKEAKKVGFTAIISTSHYLQNYYEYNEQERTELLEHVKQNIDNNSVGGLELYLGSEIYISPEIVKIIKEGKASTINNSKYVLFELPMRSKPIYVKDIIYELIENGYVPVIAHPERYSYVQEDESYAEELKSMGALFQANYGSIIGMYGSSAKRTLKKLLKNNLISFLGSDVHKIGQVYPKIPKILRKLEHLVSKEKLEELTTLNAQKVIDGKDIFDSYK